MESLPDRSKYCRSGSAVQQLFWRLPSGGGIDLSGLGQHWLRYLNQRCLLISEVLWHSPESNSIVSAQVTILYNEFENCTFKLVPHLPGANGLKNKARIEVNKRAMPNSSWWCHEMEMLSTLLAICEGNPMDFSKNEPIMFSFGVFMPSAQRSFWTNSRALSDLKCHVANMTSH